MRSRQIDCVYSAIGYRRVSRPPDCCRAYGPRLFWILREEAAKVISLRKLKAACGTTSIPMPKVLLGMISLPELISLPCTLDGQVSTEDFEQVIRLLAEEGDRL